MEYKLVFRIANIKSPEEMLEKAMVLLTERVIEDSQYTKISEVKLYNIIISPFCQLPAGEALNIFVRKWVWGCVGGVSPESTHPGGEKLQITKYKLQANYKFQCPKREFMRPV